MLATQRVRPSLCWFTNWTLSSKDKKRLKEEANTPDSGGWVVDLTGEELTEERLVLGPVRQ